MYAHKSKDSQSQGWGIELDCPVPDNSRTLKPLQPIVYRGRCEMHDAGEILETLRSVVL
jgi:hypothetical protein